MAIPYFFKTTVNQINVVSAAGQLTSATPVAVFTTDIQILNHNQTQAATVIVYATTASAPTDDDIVLENILNAKGGAVRLSCKLFPPNTRFFVNTTTAGIIVGIEALGSA